MVKQIFLKVLQNFETCLSVSNNLCKNYFHDSHQKSYFIIILELLLFHFLLLTLIYQVVNWITLRLRFDIQSFYSHIISNQNKFLKCFIILSQFLVKNSKYVILLCFFDYEKDCCMSCMI